VRLTSAAIAVSLLAAGCAGHVGRPVSRARDPRTAAALLRIATVFNADYAGGEYGPVYERWDARSRTVISRAEYIKRHRLCPPAPFTAHVVDASRGPDGAWLVHYVISGVRLTDYWFYVRGRWVFDLPRSNPDAVRLYRLPTSKYVAALGCAH
jgi:hypothetical protein